MLMQIKHLLNKIGYDVKKYHPIFETTVKQLGIHTVVDIGANVGNFSKQMREEFPNAKIYMFEPLADCFQEIQKKFSEDKNHEAFQCALGNTKGETVIARSSFHPSSSILRMSELHKRLYPKTASVRDENIKMDKLDDVLAHEILTKNILVKIDVQGFEDKVIAGGQNIIKQASAIIIETSFVMLYENQPLFGDIHDTLRALGFAYHGDIGRHYSRLTGELIYEDSLFLKK